MGPPGVMDGMTCRGIILYRERMAIYRTGNVPAVRSAAQGIGFASGALVQLFNLVV